MHKFSYLLGLWYFIKSNFAGMRGCFFMFYNTFYCEKYEKMQKNTKKCKKNTKKFAYIKNLL